jgi:hypothetical protein
MKLLSDHPFLIGELLARGQGPQKEGRTMSDLRNLAGIALMGLIAVPLALAGAVTLLLLCLGSLALNLMES